MRGLAVLSICLHAACGSQWYDERGRMIYMPGEVAADWQGEYDTLAAEVCQLAGYRILGYGQSDSTVKIVEGPAEILARRLTTQPGVIAFVSGPLIYMPPIRELGQDDRALVLAHEIGHQMGLEHIEGDYGLMVRHLDVTLRGRAAEALVEALRDGGVL